MNNDQMESIDLSAYDDAFEGAVVEVPDTSPVPDGQYTAAIDEVFFTRSKTSDEPMLKWKLKIVDGPQKGRVLWRNNMLSSIEWLKKDLYTCGVQIARLSELDLDTLLDRWLAVVVKTKNDRQNVYINKLVSVGTPQDGVPRGAYGPGASNTDGVLF